jgi:lipopolysaccharide export system protein LptC
MKSASLAPSFLFPFMVLVLLAGLSFWLASATDVPLTRNDKAALHEPDSFVNQLTFYRHDASGRLKYRLAAPRLEHFPDDDSTRIEAPLLTSYREDGPEVTLSGKWATVTEAGKHILVEEDVVVTRAAYGKRSAMVARTPELVILPDEGRAFNQHPVRITEGESWLKGVGVEIDYHRGLFTLKSRVSGEYFGNPARPPNRSQGGMRP